MEAQNIGKCLGIVYREVPVTEKYPHKSKKGLYFICDPDIRWFSADEALREPSSEKLMPPLVSQLRKMVKEWRDSCYVGSTDISKSPAIKSCSILVTETKP